MSNAPFEQRPFASKKVREIHQPHNESLSEIISHYMESYKEVECMKACLSYSGKSKEQAIEANEYLLRSQIIMAYSAFDLFMHEILYHGFEMMQRGKLDSSRKYKAFKIEKKEKGRSFKEQYRVSFGHETYVSKNWEDVIIALGFEPVKVADLYNEKMKTSCRGNAALNNLNNELDNRARRRNNLVHAYDFDIYSGRQSEIDEKTSEDFVSFINGVVNSICEYIDIQWNRGMNTFSGIKGRERKEQPSRPEI